MYVSLISTVVANGDHDDDDHDNHDNSSYFFCRAFITMMMTTMLMMKIRLDGSDGGRRLLIDICINQNPLLMVIVSLSFVKVQTKEL